MIINLEFVCMVEKSFSSIRRYTHGDHDAMICDITVSARNPTVCPMLYIPDFSFPQKYEIINRSHCVKTICDRRCGMIGMVNPNVLFTYFVSNLGFTPVINQISKQMDTTRYTKSRPITLPIYLLL